MSVSTTHPLPRAALRESMAIIGRTGMGKSYTARGAVEILLEDGERVCVIDPTGVWWGLRSSADGKSGGFPVVVFGGDHADVELGEGAESAKPLAHLVATRNVPIVLDVSDMTMGARVRFMTVFLDELYRSNKRPLTLVIDEADLFAPQRALPDQTVMLSRMEQIVRRGRVRGFRPWMITQRPAELHKSVLSQANTLIALQLTAPQDRDAIGAWIEGQADRDEGKRVLADLPKLKKGEGWIWSPSHDVLERVRFPVIGTFDSGRSPEEGEAAEPAKLADVDLSEIREQFAVAREKAAAEDPAALRKRVAELEAELGQACHIDAAALDDARAQGRLEGRAAAAKALDEHFARLSGSVGDLEAVLHRLRSDVGSWLLTAPADKILFAWKPATDEHPIPAPTPPHLRPISTQSRPAAARALEHANGALSKAERAILTALAQYPQGRAKNQVGVLTGYAVSGGGFNNAISSLRTKGYLEGDGARLVITPAGKVALGAFTPLPRGRALLEHWCGQLSKAERKALETLAEVYPRSLSKAQLANRSGYEANGGGFNNALSRLRTLELVHGRAELKASEDLFG